MNCLISKTTLLSILMLVGCASQQMGEQSSAARQEAEALFQQGYEARFHTLPIGEGQNKYTQAAILFEQAIAADSTFAPAYAYWAVPLIYATGYKEELTTDERYDLARRAIDKALELDPNLGAAHVAKAIVQYLIDGDLEGVEARFVSAIEVDPTDTEAHRELALLYFRSGRYDEALAEVERAYETDPRSLEVYESLSWIYRVLGRFDEAIEFARRKNEGSPQHPGGYTNLAFTLIMNRDYEAALEVARRGVDVAPDAAATNLYLGWSSAKTGNLEAALAAYERAFELRGNQADVGNLGWIHALIGNRDEALQVISELEATLEEGQYAVAWYIADIYLALGDNDQALDWLERSCDMRIAQNQLAIKNWGWRLTVEEEYDPLRAEPRFQGIVVKTGYQM